jgi:ribonuclease Z
MSKFPIFGVDPAEIEDIILTHIHADHVAGFPNMITEMWLLGRKTPMRLYGLDHCLSRIEQMHYAYTLDTLPALFPMDYIRVPEHDRAPVLENADFRITAWGTKHFVPTIGLRIENKITGKVLAYSCDTEPIPAIIDLARDADILIHEATGETPGHSSAAQAGVIAAQANVGALYLIHYPPPHYLDVSGWVTEAEEVFEGFIALAEDYDVIEF